MSEILSDIKILDLTRVVSGPWATQLLADMGATVYKIERPVAGDDSRAMRPFWKDAEGKDTNETAFYLFANRGKQSITVDTAQPEGAALVRELAAKCDVMIDNFKAGGLKKYGLDYESIRKINPSIVYCSITGFGQDGPFAARPAYDSVMQAIAGMMSMCGEPDGPPMRTPLPISDVTTGYVAAVSILGALWHRQKTGQGQFIDTAMLDTTVQLNAQLAIAYLVMGEVPRRVGNVSPNIYPSGVFPTKNSEIIMVCPANRQYESLCKLIGRPELIEDQRFKTNVLRRQNRPELAVELTKAFVARTSEEWAELLENAGVPCGAINSIEDVFNNPQVKHRGIRIEVPHPSGRTATLMRSPLRFSETPVVHRSPPTLGQHTDAVLGGVLGKSAEEIARLRAGGIV